MRVLIQGVEIIIINFFPHLANLLSRRDAWYSIINDK